VKITIKQDGDICMETNGATPAEIAGVILSVQRELRKTDLTKLAEDRPVDLSDMQGATYDWMIAHDKDQGIHISSIARAFSISNGAAGQRCYQLVKDGFATKICNGRYRAVTQ
jgi:hypothetical protein